MFPVDSITWEIYLTDSDNTSLGQLFYNGDTVHINDLVYHSIQNGVDEEFLIREDTINGKIWFKRSNFYFEEIEVLMVDLELEKNDSIIDIYNSFRNIPNEVEYVQVEKVDTVRGRKIIEFNRIDGILNIATPMRYIEGIGCSFGFPNLKYDLICKIFHINELVYAIDSSKQFSCPILYNVNAYNISDYVSLFPNPTSSSLQINLKEPSLINSKLNLYSIHGKLIYQSNLDQTTTKINLSSFQPQMLIVDIEKDDVHYISKILKQ